MTLDETVWTSIILLALLIWVSNKESSGQLLQEDFLWEVCSKYFHKNQHLVMIISLNAIPLEISSILTHGLQDHLGASIMHIHINEINDKMEDISGKYYRSVLVDELWQNADKLNGQRFLPPTSYNSNKPTNFASNSMNTVPFNVCIHNDLTLRTQKHSQRTFSAFVPNKMLRNVCRNFIIISDNELAIVSYFSNLDKNNSCWNPRDSFLIILLLKFKVTSEIFRKKSGFLLQTLWQTFQIMTAIVINIREQPCKLEVIEEVIAFDPFKCSFTNFGKVEVVNAGHIENLLTYSVSATRKYNGYPLRVTMFPRMPTAINRTDNKTHVFTSFNYSEPYVGIDGMMLHTLAKQLLFTPEIQLPTDRKYYGYDLPNGTFVGTLGDILYGRTDFSLNGVFIKTYNTNSIEFSHYAYHDSVCVIVPKAEQIPKWKMFGGLHLELKLGIFIVYIISSCIYYLQKQCHRYWNNNQNTAKVTTVFLEMFHPFLSLPFAKFPGVASQKILACATLIFGMLTGSMLQGIMVTSMAKPFYYPEIDTLEELYYSGLPIFTGSPNLADTFGPADQCQDSTSVMLKLSRKLQLVSDPTEDKWDIIARERNQAIIIRRSDSLDRFKADGKLHVTQECPRSYLIAYLFPKGSPFLPMIDRTLARLLEAGLPDKWTRDTYFSILITEKTYTTSVKEVFTEFSLEDMQVAFFILFGGWALSTITFVFEISFAWCNY